MGWASGFRAGSEVAGEAIDTYNAAKERGRLQAINQAQPTEIPNAYTSQDAEQLRALANARDAEGKPYYNLEAGTDGSYGLKTNFAYQGQDGQTVQPGGVATTFTPRASTMEFMGTRYAAEDLIPERVAGLRARAMADVVSERDPVRGLAMQQAIKSGERDDRRFSWEEQDRPLKQRGLEQQVRTGDIQLGQAERGLKVQELTDEVAKMPIEALKAYAAKLNTNESNLPFLMVGEGKGGYKFLTIDPKTGRPMGKEFTLNDAQLRELATASVLGMSGFGQESMAKLTSVNKDIADIVSKMNSTTAQVVESQNNATYRANADSRGERQLGLQAQGLQLRQQEINRRNQVGSMENEINGVLEGYQAALAAGPDGKQAAAIYAREYDQLRAIAAQRGLKVPPALSALTAAQKDGPAARPVKVEAEGEVYRMPDGRVMRATGLGGFVDAQRGIMPNEVGSVLAQSGVPQELIPMVQLSNDGTAVMFRGMEFDPRDPRDMKELVNYARRQGANDIAVEEANRSDASPRRDTGFGPKITYAPKEGAPSIYADPEEWMRYRGLQQGR